MAILTGKGMANAKDDANVRSSKSTDNTEEMIEPQTQEQTADFMMPSASMIPAMPSPAILPSGDGLRRLQSLIYDLQRYSKDSAASMRIDKANIHPFCLGPPYLSLTLANTLLDQILSHHTTVRQYLGNILEGKGYFVCTSHTLAPELAKIFGIQDTFVNQSSFTDFYARFCAAARFCGEEVALAPSETTTIAARSKNSKSTGPDVRKGKKRPKKTGKEDDSNTAGHR